MDREGGGRGTLRTVDGVGAAIAQPSSLALVASIIEAVACTEAGVPPMGSRPPPPTLMVRRRRELQDRT
jgi:hypothetical protein